MSLTIEANPNKSTRVTVEDANNEDEDTQLPECSLVVQDSKGDLRFALLNPYQAEAVGNALLRWVKDVTVETDEELDDDEDDDELDDEDEASTH
jgi:hypothetical protein